jgi:hypothetical protein
MTHIYTILYGRIEDRRYGWQHDAWRSCYDLDTAKQMCQQDYNKLERGDLLQWELERPHIWVAQNTPDEDGVNEYEYVILVSDLVEVDDESEGVE